MPEQTRVQSESGPELLWSLPHHRERLGDQGVGLRPQLMGCASACIRVPIYLTGTMPQMDRSPRKMPEPTGVCRSCAGLIGVIRDNEDEVRNDEDK